MVYHEADGCPRGDSAMPVVAMWAVDDVPGAPQRAVERIWRRLGEQPTTMEESG